MNESSQFITLINKSNCSSNYWYISAKLLDCLMTRVVFCLHISRWKIDRWHGGIYMLPKPIDFNLFTKDTFPCATVLKQASPRCVSSCLNPWLFFAHSQRGSLSINSANIVNGRCRYRTATRRFVYRIFMEMENMADRRSDCGFSSFPPPLPPPFLPIDFTCELICVCMCVWVIC